MHNFLEKLKLNILFLMLCAFILKFKYFHGVKKNRGISRYNHQIERL